MNQFELTNNVGAKISIPATADDDLDYFQLSEVDEIKRYYNSQGYVVIRNAIPATLIDSANVAFEQEVLPSRRFIYRQATANPERHVLTPQGFMLNSLLNPHCVDLRFFPRFRDASSLSD